MAVNEKLAAMADGKGVQFLDTGDKFLDASGGLAKVMMPDFLHLSQAGYAFWGDAIAKPVENVLKGSP